MNTELRDKLYNDWLVWDNEWSNELEKVYGRNAGDYRYDPKRNAATERLAYLREQFHNARIAYYAYTKGNG